MIEEAPSSLARKLIVLIWMPAALFAIGASYYLLFSGQMFDQHWFFVFTQMVLILYAPFVVASDLEKVLIADQDPVYDLKLELVRLKSNTYIKATKPTLNLYVSM